MTTPLATALLLLAAAAAAGAPPAPWPNACTAVVGATTAYNQTRCPANMSCQPNGFSVSGMGCCPWPASVSCGDYACCPAGSTCVHVSGSAYSEVFNCAGAAPATGSRCPCKPGAPLPWSTSRKNVLIIGDSLSIGYTPAVAALLADVALVQHAPWDVSDGGAEEAAYLEQCLDNWLASPSGVPATVDVIYFNSGMHNLAASGGTPGQGGTYVEYAGQLARVTARLTAYAAATRTALIYGLTTPWLNSVATDGVITGVLNPNASAIMAAAGVPVVDQHAPIVAKCGAAPTASCFGLAGCWSPHCPPGYEWLAETVIAPAIRAALALDRAQPPGPPAAAAAGAAPRRCYAPYPSTASRRFETPCFDVLASGGGVDVRGYTALANASIVHADIAKGEGFENAIFAFAYVADYFSGNNFEKQNISTARTTPLLVLPDSRAFESLWSTAMAIEPSRFLNPTRVPAPANNPLVDVNTFSDLGLTTVAALHVRLAKPAAEPDYKACGKALLAALPGVAAGRFTYDATSYWSPSYAFYYAEAEANEFDIECWVGVTDTQGDYAKA